MLRRLRWHAEAEQGKFLQKTSPGANILEIVAYNRGEKVSLSSSA